MGADLRQAPNCATRRKASGRNAVPHVPIEIVPLSGLPEVSMGEDIARLIINVVKHQDIHIAPSDIFVVAQKIISKAEGRVMGLDTVQPSHSALSWAAEWGKDARLVELVLREAKRIVRMEKGIIIAETSHGFICANAGVDVSNAPEGSAILLPLDPDASARAIQMRLSGAFGVHVGVIVSDTFGRAWREGLVNVALGVAGLAPLLDYRGMRDANGKILQATMIAVADELASAAELVMGKSYGIPVAIVRGVASQSPDGSGRDLIRPAEKDLFR
jgi:coenzyme F420-0:L-glutamate ligase/coenzyme F420-1:gamma-L-glutamate ligase